MKPRVFYSVNEVGPDEFEAVVQSVEGVESHTEQDVQGLVGEGNTDDEATRLLKSFIAEILGEKVGYFRIYDDA